MALGLFAPASASAATVTVTGDDGNPVALTPGVATPLRTINQTVALDVPQGDGASYKWIATGPSGTTATSISTDNCWSTIRKDSGRIVYAGNGPYTLTLSTYTDTRCTSGAKSTAYSWSVNAGVSLGQPGGPLLLRPANSLTTNTHLIDFAGNPGTSVYEVRYAKGGTIGPDGAIAGPSNPARVDDATGKVAFSPYDGPGAYVMVARATYLGAATPWSAPITINMQSPFDISSVSFPDSRGPSYQLAATVREKAIAGGRVTVAVAKGKKGKRFRTLGKARVNSQGVLKLRFRLARGTYRVRFSYSGGPAVTRGTQYGSMRITRRIF
ncbi:hypothetical protein [Solirubrobacter deserti]|uniref:Bacterial Ig-like domain-containing protein n=1 Tax=Solirubrobacter deserti TaxID=2282478 RepID=A0ABT4RQK1_9ACTN|nr:hypothetical protein [Solirubrobacter deserti]MDA0140843.1 hypothetical protein [Solirubrobacter deserti]